ncbi:hypothetical protein BSKO_05540 [Bryopsis sp. KO-2023]|nr:hypothetical protein BSKO_05540 [Bryopsis sp. KO-2023]
MTRGSWWWVRVLAAPLPPPCWLRKDTPSVIEKRARPQASDPPIRRGVMFCLKPKSVEIMGKIGIHVPPDGFLDGMHTFQGSHVIVRDGEKQSIKLNDSSILVERHVFAFNIIKAIEKKELKNLTICFEASCTAIDMGSRIVKYTSSDGVEHEEPYDLLIGADGVNSIVRQALEAFDPTLKVRQMRSSSRYKTIRGLPRPDDAEELLELGSPGYFVMILTAPCRLGGKRINQLGLAVYQTEDGLFHLNVAGAVEDLEALEGNEREWVENHAPRLLSKSWKEELIKQLSAAPMNIGSPVTYCSSMIGPSVSIIGDAAHSTSPTHGVGANMAIQDGDELASALDACDGDVAQGLKMFERARLEEIHSIIRFEELTKYSRLEKPHRLGIALKSFLDAFHTKGHKLLPKLIPKPVNMRVVFGEITYPQARRIFEREARVVCSLGIAVAGIVSSAAWVYGRGMIRRN